MSEHESDNEREAHPSGVDHSSARWMLAVPAASTARTAAPLAYPQGATLRALDEMIPALDKEIHAIRQQHRRRPTARLDSGRRLPDPNRRTYRYELLERLRGIGPGDQVDVVTEDEVYTCSVAAITPTSLDLLFADDCGDIAPAGQLITDTNWINERVRDVLVEVRDDVQAGRPGFGNLSMALASVGLFGYRSSRGEVDDDILDGLTDEQADAVRLGVGSELAFVIGPAGCGKSRVVARVCEALVRRGDRVLLLAPSNRAVDLALNKVVERLASELDGTNGYPILRVGGGVTSQLSENARKHTALEHILDRLLGDGSDNWTELPDQHRSQVRQTLVWSCKLAAATLHNACLSRLLREGNWDAVVIDEASMAIPPILFLAARLARKRVVVIGDHNQLPPVVQTKDPVAQRWLLRDVFDLSGIPEAIEDEDPPRCLVMLTRQFRMAAQIARLHNEVFYTGRLDTDDAPELRDPPLGCESLLYVNSGRLIPRSRTEQVDGSRRNPGHVEIIAALVHRIEHRARGVPTLILSPFRSQVRAIREVLGRRRAIDIGTIHSCQGSEAKIVVLDLTEGWGCRQTSFLSRDELRWMGNRLLNVAISRAEQHLILVADFDYFEEGYNRAGTYTWNLLRWFRKHGLEINPHALLRRRAA